MNKRGLLLRDMVFMIIIFGVVMALASIMVYDMASEYGNSNMSSEYGSDEVSGLGSIVLDDAEGKIDTMRSSTEPTNESSEGLIGAFSNLGGALRGASTIIGIVFTSPIIIGRTLVILMDSIGVPLIISNIISTAIILLIYALVIFGIISAALRGGKV